MTFESRAAQPFLRWAGGKSWLANHEIALLSSIPIHRYFEPFLGSGAIFFALAPPVALLSDVNGPLANSFVQVRDHPKELVDAIRGMTASRAAYDLVRTQQIQEGIEGAARFLYLNRLGFNGIFRVNRSGAFNVPFGGDRSLDYFWRNDRLIRASRALQGVTVNVADFESQMSTAETGDLVYCDPVYLMPGQTEHFRRYTATPFDSADLARLSSSIDGAVGRGATVVLSWIGDLPKTNLVAKCIDLTRRSSVYPKAQRCTRIEERLAVYHPSMRAVSRR